MTSKEFVIWLRGFIAGSNNYNLTPEGWQALKDNLKEVDDNYSPYSTQDTNSLAPKKILIKDEIKPLSKKRKKKTVEDWEEEIDLGGHE